MSQILRYVAFATDPSGGNPAGVVLDAADLTVADMKRIAAGVGYSETAFVTDTDQSEPIPRLTVRYFSPAIEVDFCGHATIAASVAWGERHGPGTMIFETASGDIAVDVTRDGDGLRAALTSVPTSVSDVPEEVLDEALAALGWSREALDPDLPPKIAFGGVDHLVLGAYDRKRLARLEYDFDRLRRLMEIRRWTTLQLVHRETPELFHARNPFPVGGVVEDPATGAAAAAFGGYLRELGLAEPGSRFLLVQGEDMGRKSLLHVEILERRVRVSGHARQLPAQGEAPMPAP